jgi:XTP/dITP diphosphohydrolase
MTGQPSPAAPPATGGEVYRLAEVMDRLRGPGGCPWDAKQDHGSLVQYLLEESYEVVDAIEAADPAALREELGDLLLQVVFHAAIARTDPVAFDLDDVAGDVADKLIRRHPHVFTPTDDGGADLTAEQSYARWDRIKAVEKARTSVLDGIPHSQGALARTQKVLGRARRGGLDIATLSAPHLPGASEPPTPQTDPSTDIGGRLLAVILEAEALGIDAEGALRTTMRALEATIRAEEERARRDLPGPPSLASGEPNPSGADTTRR